MGGWQGFRRFELDPGSRTRPLHWLDGASKFKLSFERRYFNFCCSEPPKQHALSHRAPGKSTDERRALLRAKPVVEPP